ncbi:MAG: type IX secretion system membrane protein PorP/SprF [Cyclobacteriaceae bacterium]|nr:type IX secretion system membrane protein PorP/SprF [Cyclobacteriaceae bacterium]
MRLLISILLCFTGISVLAQDPEFSQYYAAPLYLNPAFTGTTNDHRFIANYRNQWPNIARGYVTTALSYDYNMYHANSGVGFLATMDQAGTAGMKSSQFNFLYSYRVVVANKWVIASGLSFGYAFRTIDYNKLVFGDQLQFDSRAQVPSDDPALFNLGMSSYFDFNSGILAYNKTFWIGFSASHLNQPNRSLLNQESVLPIKTSIHGGIRIPLSRSPLKHAQEPVLSPSFVYKHQGRFDQLDVGAYFLYQPIVVGLWYRGIPIQQEANDNLSQDAVVVILGFQLPKFEIMYSYDFTVSNLGSISGGTHELAIKYKLEIVQSAKTKKRGAMIPCPTFTHHR